MAASSWRWSIEYAKTGWSTCKGCAGKIEQGAMRIGDAGGAYVKWQHLRSEYGAGLSYCKFLTSLAPHHTSCPTHLHGLSRTHFARATKTRPRIRKLATAATAPTSAWEDTTLGLATPCPVPRLPWKDNTQAMRPGDHPPPFATCSRILKIDENHSRKNGAGLQDVNSWVLIVE